MFKKRKTNEKFNNSLLINKNRELTELLDKIAVLAIGNVYNNKDITLKK